MNTLWTNTKSWRHWINHLPDLDLSKIEIGPRMQGFLLAILLKVVLDFVRALWAW